MQVTVQDPGGATSSTAISAGTVANESIRQAIYLRPANGAPDVDRDGITLARIVELAGVDPASADHVEVRDLSHTGTDGVSLTGDEVARGFADPDAPGSQALVVSQGDSGLVFLRPRRSSSDANANDVLRTDTGDAAVLGVRIVSDAAVLTVDPPAWPTRAKAGEPLTLAAPQVSRGGVPIASPRLQWDFGDVADARGSSNVHTYAGAGTYEARVIAIDPATGDRGASAPVRITVAATGGTDVAPGDTDSQDGAGSKAGSGGVGDAGAGDAGRSAGGGPAPGAGGAATSPAPTPGTRSTRATRKPGSSSRQPTPTAAVERPDHTTASSGATGTASDRAGSPAAGASSSGSAAGTSPGGAAAPPRVARSAAQDGTRRRRAAAPVGRPSRPPDGLQGVLLAGAAAAPVPLANVTSPVAPRASEQPEASGSGGTSAGGWVLAVLGVAALIGCGVWRELDPRGRWRTLAA